VIAEVAGLFALLSMVLDGTSGPSQGSSVFEEEIDWVISNLVDFYTHPRPQPPPDLEPAVSELTSLKSRLEQEKRRTVRADRPEDVRRQAETIAQIQARIRELSSQLSGFEHQVHRAEIAQRDWADAVAEGIRRMLDRAREAETLKVDREMMRLEPLMIQAPGQTLDRPRPVQRKSSPLVRRLESIDQMARRFRDQYDPYKQNAVTITDGASQVTPEQLFAAIVGLRQFGVDVPVVSVFETGDVPVAVGPAVPRAKVDVRGKTVMFTGGIERDGHIISREEVRKLIEEKGAKLVTMLDDQVDYVIVGENPINNRIEKANQLGKPLIPARDVLPELFQGSAPAAGSAGSNMGS
jgi:hypothetical protein